MLNNIHSFTFHQLPLNSYSSSFLEYPELSLSCLAQVRDNAYPRKHARPLSASAKNNNIADTDLRIDHEQPAAASQSSARILCLGHGVGIYTSVIVQPLWGIPSCMYLFAFYDRGV